MLRQEIVLVLVLAFALIAIDAPLRAEAVPDRYRQVERTLGKTGDFKDNVFRIELPRNDIAVAIAGKPAPPALGLTGNISMIRGQRNQEVTMCEWVLLQQEVNPILTSLRANRFQVTAIHNHFFWETPRIIFIHFQGTGTANDLAKRVKPALDMIGKVALPPGIPATAESEPSAGPAATGRLQLDTGRLDRIVGEKGQVQEGGVYQYELDRNDIRLTVQGARITGRMGLHIEAEFGGTNTNAIVVSEMGLLPAEVEPVLDALRQQGFTVTAVHNHMIGTNPEIIFVHFEAMGNAENLARGFRAALQKTGLKK